MCAGPPTRPTGSVGIGPPSRAPAGRDQATDVEALCVTVVGSGPTAGGSTLARAGPQPSADGEAAHGERTWAKARCPRTRAAAPGSSAWPDRARPNEIQAQREPSPSRTGQDQRDDRVSPPIGRHRKPVDQSARWRNSRRWTRRPRSRRLSSCLQERFQNCSRRGRSAVGLATATAKKMPLRKPPWKTINPPRRTIILRGVWLLARAHLENPDGRRSIASQRPGTRPPRAVCAEKDSGKDPAG